MHSPTFTKLIVTLAALLLPLAGGCLPRASREVVEVQGILAGEIVWRGEVRVRGDVVLERGAHLRILPGTTVVFLPAGDRELWSEHPHFVGSELVVRGELLAEGDAERPIVFRYVDVEAPAGSWGGINLVESPEARFRFCRFTQADSAVHSQKSTVIIENCLFEGNRVGVRFHASALLLEHSLLRGNGTAVRFHEGAPVICHNLIRDNDKGIFITSHPQDYRIEANNITANREANVVLGEEVPEEVRMPGNWWGTTVAERIEAGFFDGRRVDYLGRVRYEPALQAPATTEVDAWSR